MSAEMLIGLIAAIRETPDLEGALCAGEWKSFDETDDSAVINAAIELCQWCPALDRCRQWVDSLPLAKRPPGVIAGQVHKWVSHESLRRPQLIERPTTC